MDCAVFILADIRLNASASAFTMTMASLWLTASVRALAEGLYPFQLHLPVTDGNVWSYQQMGGQLKVSAIADARSSNVTLCQGAGCNVTATYVFDSTNGALGPVAVRVAAADVHSFAVLRSGEILSVVATGPSNVTQTVPAVFDDATKQYIARFASLTVAGSYVVELVSALSRVAKANFTLVCALGYVTGSQGECLPQRSVCEMATGVAPPAGGFVVQRTMVLSNLGKARFVELLPVLSATSFGVADGRASVQLVSPGPFLVRVTDADGRQCTVSQQLLVGCPAGFELTDGGCRCHAGYQNVNGNCQPVIVDDVCAGLTAKGQTGARVDADTPFSLGDRLQLVVNTSNPAAVSRYQFELTPMQGKISGDITELVPLDQTGAFSLTVLATPLIDGPTVSCPVLPALKVAASRTCDKVQATFQLGNSSVYGAESTLRASVTLATGSAATSIVASPRDSSVPVPLSQTAARASWEGTATLPTTGEWAISVNVGSEQCVSRFLNVTCSPGFVSDGLGRCRCPQGYENVNGKCLQIQVVIQPEPCDHAVIRSSQANAPFATFDRGSASVTFGTVLSVSLGAGTTPTGIKTLLVPTQGTETLNVTDRIPLVRTGQFSLQLEYPSAAGPRQCGLIPSIQVVCGADETEVDGQCRPIVKSLCDQASLTISQADDAVRGAQSLVMAKLSLSSGANASLIASPLQSAIQVPLAPDGSPAWEGNASLPSTGAWALQLSVGGELCPRYSRTVQVDCTAKAGFVDDGSGRCVCPQGLENQGGTCVVPAQRDTASEPDPCQDAMVDSSVDGRLFASNLSDTFLLRPGSQLSVRVRTAAKGEPYETLLIPSQGTETRNISDNITLTTGTFGLQLKYRSSSGETKQCPLLQKLVVECADGDDEVNGICQVCGREGWWFDPQAHRCSRWPRMALIAASDRLAIVHTKRPSKPSPSSTVEIRLVSGDVEAASILRWTATSGHSWLQISPSSGTVSSTNPVATVNVTVLASGHGDTAVSGPLASHIKLSSSLRGRSDLFEHNTSTLNMKVEVRVNPLRGCPTPACTHALVRVCARPHTRTHARAHAARTHTSSTLAHKACSPNPSLAPGVALTHAKAHAPAKSARARTHQHAHMDTQVMIEATALLMTQDIQVLTRDAQQLTYGSEVPINDMLTVTANVYDYERLRICRTALLIKVELSQFSSEPNRTQLMQHFDGNTYRTELPSSWIEQPGRYTLWIDGGAVTIEFTVAQSSASVYIAAGIGSVRSNRRCVLMRALLSVVRVAGTRIALGGHGFSRKQAKA
jgi:hypothetical protein